MAPLGEAPRGGIRPGPDLHHAFRKPLTSSLDLAFVPGGLLAGPRVQQKPALAIEHFPLCILGRVRKRRVERLGHHRQVSESMDMGQAPGMRGLFGLACQRVARLVDKWPVGLPLLRHEVFER